MKRIVIIGAGIVGLAVARELSINGHRDITIIEKESNIATHQSSRNSGVMHAGLYYKPRSLKAELSREGINMLKKYCSSNHISWNECGKVVVSTKKNQSNQIDKLFYNGQKNNLSGLKKITSQEVNKIEPYVNAIEGIYVPEESVVSYKEVAECLLKEVNTLGVKVKFNSKFKKYLREKKEILLANNEKIKAEVIISASGLYGDKVAKLLDLNIDNQMILPFRGEYYYLKDKFKYLVQGLIYPIPSPKFPFLGVHFTKMIDGEIEAGPNAVLAMAREGYDWQTINLEELKESLLYPGLRNFVKKYPLITFGEIARSFSKKLFVKSLKDFIPDIEENMLIKGDSGVRAQLINTSGDLIEDFDIRVKGNIASILNAPSPAATSSLAIAKYVVDYLNL